MWLVTSWDRFVLIILIHKTALKANTIFSYFINRKTKAQRTRVKPKTGKWGKKKEFNPESQTEDLS